MLTIRKSQDRGHADHGWLNSYHSFSFAGYHDPRHMGWGNLRVINEDRIAPGTGFGAHGHRDMEIISYVLSGELAHQDSMGNVKGIPPGDVQRMSAGSGVMHSEFNHAPDQVTHFLQIWIKPATAGIAPSYDQKDFSGAHGIKLIVSPDGRDGSLKIHQDACLYKVLLKQETSRTPLAAGRTYYLHVACGGLEFNGQRLAAGDGPGGQTSCRLSVI